MPRQTDDPAKHVLSFRATDSELEKILQLKRDKPLSDYLRAAALKEMK